MGTPIVGRDAVLAMLGSGIDLFDPSSMKTEIHTMVADADHVAVRLTFRTRTAAGVDYRNEYLLLFAIRDDRITEVWEQPDTLYQEQMGVFASYR
jgi:ketosteroid isomerase-like protein